MNPNDDHMRKIAELVDAAIYKRQGMLGLMAAAFLDATGVPADQVELVETVRAGGMEVSYYFRKRPVEEGDGAQGRDVQGLRSPTDDGKL